MQFEKPFPVQSPSVVARKKVKGLEKGKKSVSPCGLLAFGKVLMTIFPFVRNIYWKLELGKLKRFAAKLKRKKNEEIQAVHSAE